MQSEDVVQQLLKFVSENGRLPEDNEPEHGDLVRAAVEAFGSLENALKMAGLLTTNNQATPLRIAKKSTTTQRSELKVSDKKYPPEYFLSLLNLNQQKHYGPPPVGAPTWWERKANSIYTCSACKRPIEKGERYLGRKKLHPGQKGIYGYRGTYSTDYYHIVCVLKDARTEVNGNIQRCITGINMNQREIDGFRIEASSNIGQIDNCKRIILQTEDEFKKTKGVFGRIGKWFKNKYNYLVKNREIERLRGRISIIENIEIPRRQRNINDLTMKKADLQLRINQLDDKIRELYE